MVNLQPATPEEITELARKVVTNVVFIANSEEAVSNAFGTLLMFLKDIPDEEIEKIGAMWEEWDKAGPRSINGYPFFFSAHFVHRDDLEPLEKEIERMEKALGGVT